MTQKCHMPSIWLCSQLNLSLLKLLHLPTFINRNTTVDQERTMSQQYPPATYGGDGDLVLLNRLQEPNLLISKGTNGTPEKETKGNCDIKPRSQSLYSKVTRNILQRPFIILSFSNVLPVTFTGPPLQVLHTHSASSHSVKAKSYFQSVREISKAKSTKRSEITKHCQK